MLFTSNKATPAPLTELRTALDRIDALTEHARIAYRVESLREEVARKKLSSGSGSGSKKSHRLVKKGSLRAGLGGLGKKLKGKHRRDASTASKDSNSSSTVASNASSRTAGSAAKSVKFDSTAGGGEGGGGGGGARLVTPPPKTQHEDDDDGGEEEGGGDAFDDSPTAAMGGSGAGGGGAVQVGAAAESARFMPFHKDDEAEMVELLRRCAELVVHGERAAANELKKLGSGGGGGSGSSRDDYEEEEYEKHQAVFEYFCEREGLQTIVNIVTGLAFKPVKDEKDKGDEKEMSFADDATVVTADTDGSDATDKAAGSNDADDAYAAYGGEEEEEERTLLPPMSIATQAVQSVCILLQNVVRVTSLYFLLSNNRVNDLIDLPLDLYRIAEDTARLASGGKLQPGPSGRDREQSAEMAEFTTHFVSFLKSLAMRMNEETLQFFLTYPSAETASERYFSAAAGALSTPSSMGGGHDVGGFEVDVTADTREVEFPLYARALQFCNKDQDSFVRVTAMNICLNTIRLATLSDDDGGDLEGGHGHGAGAGSGGGNPSQFKSPDGGSLHRSAALPFRERVAITHHVCNPARVEGLVSPIFMKLAQQCGALEETIRCLDELEAELRSCGEELRAAEGGEKEGEKKKKKKKKERGGEEEKTLSSDADGDGSGDAKSDDERSESSRTVAEIRDEIEKIESRRRYLAGSFEEVSADLQDELLLLEDVLKVGLSSVNEQTIEMMLATFIYPLLLQPLRQFMQRHRPPQPPPPTSGGGADSSSADDASDGSNDLPQTEAHPFSADSIANSLLRSGLLEDATDSGQQVPASDDGREWAAKISDEGAVLPDSAPAKTAFFGICAVFQCITNKPLLHLLLTALFHPLAPDAEGGHIILAKPEVLSTDGRGDVCIRADSKGCISYDFGQSNQISKDGPANVDESGDTCVFVLAPALSNIFKGTMKVRSSDALDLKTRVNPYRRVILSCLGGTDEMSALQSLAVLAMDAAISSVEERCISEIMLGCGTKPSSDSDSQEEKIEAEADSTSSPQSSRSPLSPNHLIEVISSLCVSIMTASVSSDGIWKLDFNSVAANALLKSAASDRMTQAAAAKLVDHRLRQSASFLAQLPSRINASWPSASGKRSSKGATEDSNEHRLDAILDRIFNDPLLRNDRSIVEHLARKRQGQSQDSEWVGPSCVPIALMSSLDDVCNEICSGSASADSRHKRNVTSLRCGAQSAFAHIQLDAFARYFKGVMPENRQLLHGAYGKFPPDEQAQLSAGPSHGEDDDLISYDGCNGPSRTIFASLPQRLTSVLFDEEKQDAGSTHSSPVPGAIVGLIGRAAFPCVCEVSPENSSYFADRGACVVAEGVKWQSLYLVILGKYMVLAEPEKGGSGGNGRIVSSSRLACLVVEKDDPADIDPQSPARRLILTHVSPDSKKPGVFSADDSTSSSGAANNSVKMKRSKMDLWFEDETAAGRAFKAMSAKISKARSRRGHKINEALTHGDGSSDSSSLFH